MIAAYQGEETEIWLRQFNRDFKYFTDKMKLNAFVNENYEVLGISKAQSEIIQRIISRKEISDTLNLFMENMLNLNRKGIFSWKENSWHRKKMWNQYKKINASIGDEIDAWAFGVEPDLLADLVFKGEKQQQPQLTTSTQ